MTSLLRQLAAGVLCASVVGSAAACGTGTPVVQGTAVDPTAGAGAGIAPATARVTPAGGQAGTATAGTATAGVASTGPGHITSSTPSAQPTTPAVVTGSVLRLGPSDDGRVFRVRSGTRVFLDLGGPGSYWDTPTSDDPSVLRPTGHTGGYPDPGPTRAQFDAVAPGSAHISATSDAPCLHATPRCMIAQRDYRVSIVVRS